MKEYWISASGSNWDNTSNWSLTPGGPSGTTIPTSDSTVYFNSNGLGDCTVNTPISIAGLNMSSGYHGYLYQNDQDMTVGLSGANFNDGTFIGSTANIHVTGNLFIGPCRFFSTDGTLAFDGTFTHTPGVTGSFLHNNGTVVLNGHEALISAHGISFYDLQCNAASTGLDGSCFIDNKLALRSGSFGKRTDGTAYVRGDLYCESAYNEWSTDNNLPIIFDSTTRQHIYNTAGGVIPMLLINKQVSDQVLCHGTGPLYIRSDFIIYDGTFNTNGLDLYIATNNLTEDSMVMVLDETRS